MGTLPSSESQGQPGSSRITCPGTLPVSSSPKLTQAGLVSGFEDTPNFVPFPFSSLIASLKRRLFPLFRSINSNSFLRLTPHKCRGATQRKFIRQNPVSPRFSQEWCKQTLPARRNPKHLPCLLTPNSPRWNPQTRSYLRCAHGSS